MLSKHSHLLKRTASLTLITLLALPAISQACVTRHKNHSGMTLTMHNDLRIGSSAITVQGKARRCGLFQRPRARNAAARDAVNKMVDAWQDVIEAGNLHRYLVNDCRNRPNQIRVKSLYSLAVANGPNIVIPASLRPEIAIANRRIYGDARCTSYTPPKPVPVPTFEPSPPCKNLKCLPL